MNLQKVLEGQYLLWFRALQSTGCAAFPCRFTAKAEKDKARYAQEMAAREEAVAAACAEDAALARAQAEVPRLAQGSSAAIPEVDA